MLRIDGHWFRDEEGGYVLLRGICLSGSAKTPMSPLGATQLPASLDGQNGDPGAVSFVGRPLPLGEAPEHFRRLRRWGLNAIRLVVTWEAVEHAGPGQYDTEYLDYLQALCEEAERAGLYVLLDFHQDAFSRFSGGDGAPAWVFEALGLDVRALDASESAITMQRRPAGQYPYMEWPNNYNRYACATLFTLFFGGNWFAPRTLVDGQPVQQFLQSHYLGALGAAASRLKGLRCIAGVDVINEPSFGYIGLGDLARDTLVPLDGPRVSAFDGIALGNGYARKTWVRRAGGLLPVGRKVLNPDRRRAFLDGAQCVWKAHGVWRDEDGEPALLKPDYFARIEGQKINRFRACLLPLLQSAARVLDEKLPGAPIFVETDPQGMREVQIEPGELRQAVNAHHWYDFPTLFGRRLWRLLSIDIYTRRIVALPDNVRRMQKAQLAYLRKMSRDRMGDVPTVVGEFGVPFDLDEGKAFQAGNYATHSRALGRYYNLIDELGLHAFLWNYTPDNTHEHGDGWNREDLSVFSLDERGRGAEEPERDGR